MRSWGNIRRFPLDNERNRTGGAGVYYHVSVISHGATQLLTCCGQFDYVGNPRDYKWIQTTQLEKVNEQM
jgi:hypothetical protein